MNSSDFYESGKYLLMFLNPEKTLEEKMVFGTYVKNEYGFVRGR